MEMQTWVFISYMKFANNHIQNWGTICLADFMEKYITIPKKNKQVSDRSKEKVTCLCKNKLKP